MWCSGPMNRSSGGQEVTASTSGGHSDSRFGDEKLNHGEHGAIIRRGDGLQGRPRSRAIKPSDEQSTNTSDCSSDDLVAWSAAGRRPRRMLTRVQSHGSHHAANQGRASKKQCVSVRFRGLRVRAFSSRADRFQTLGCGLRGVKAKRTP